MNAFTRMLRRVAWSFKMVLIHGYDAIWMHPKTTKTEGSAHRNHTPGVYQDVTERNENGKES